MVSFTNMAELAKDASIEAVIMHSKLVHLLVLIVLSLRDSFNCPDRKHRLAELLHSSRRTFVVNNTNILIAVRCWL